MVVSQCIVATTNALFDRIMAVVFKVGIKSLQLQRREEGGRRARGREGVREGGREGGSEGGGREGVREEGGREGGREGVREEGGSEGGS